MPIDATQPYDDQNIFAKILRGEIPHVGLLQVGVRQIPEHHPAERRLA